MPTQNTEINASTLISEVNTKLRTAILNGVVWTNSNPPEGNSVMATQLQNADSVGYFSSSNIASNNLIKASHFNTELVAYLKTLTRIRNVRFIRRYDNWGSWQTQFDQTQLSIMNENPTPVADVNTEYSVDKSAPYSQNSSVVTPPNPAVTDEIITAELANNFINNLKSQWDTLKGNTVTYMRSYCYTNCYSHSNRGRR